MFTMIKECVSELCILWHIRFQTSGWNSAKTKMTVNQKITANICDLNITVYLFPRLFGNLIPLNLSIWDQ